MGVLIINLTGRCRVNQCDVNTLTATTRGHYFATAYIIRFSECPKCGFSKKGEVTCCGKGASWEGKCGHVVDVKFEHTWAQGLNVCSNVVPNTAVQESVSTTGIYAWLHVT